jgi:hypothetical protein
MAADKLGYTMSENPNEGRKEGQEKGERIIIVGGEGSRMSHILDLIATLGRSGHQIVVAPVIETARKSGEMLDKIREAGVDATLLISSNVIDPVLRSIPSLPKISRIKRNELAQAIARGLVPNIVVRSAVTFHVPITFGRREPELSFKDHRRYLRSNLKTLRRGAPKRGQFARRAMANTSLGRRPGRRNGSRK